MIIPAEFVNNIWRPQGGIPEGTLSIDASPSGYTAVTPSDFFSASPPTTGGKITNVFSGSKTLTPTFFGITYHRYPLGTTPTPITTFNMARSHDFGPGSSRVRWSSLNPSSGTYTWSTLDSFVSTHKAAGRKVIYTIFGTPSWASARPAEASSYGLGEAAEPANLANWDTFCAALATRYIGQIDYYEIWNEPNLTGFYTGTQTILSQMVRRANQTIKAIDSNAIIISPAVTALQGGAGQTYFNGMMAASDGAAGNMAAWTDVVGVHLYPNNVAGINSLPTYLTTFLSSLSGLGLGGKQVFNTEFGILSPSYSKLPILDRFNYLARMMILSAVCGGGVNSSIWYDGDPDSIQGMWNTDDTQWNTLRTLLLSGPITRVNLIADGRVCAIINGQNYIF